MTEMVKVSVIQPRNFRASKSEPYTRYPVGIREMPIEHARELGLLHRIVKESDTEEGVMVRMPFEGRFDDKLTSMLVGAGINTLEELRGASRDSLLAIDGVGPSAMTRIDVVLKGGK